MTGSFNARSKLKFAFRITSSRNEGVPVANQ
ncbi:MAG: hypothetical protein BWX73_02520 [Lentisphaerae bacterium ADurb.Bin082]|nr:MAG: hypothetical protein BWX73_02520 [Lentisphaerae bacterium ADurb.Bin082]